MAILCIVVFPSKAKLMIFLYCNCFLIVFTVSVYSLLQQLQRVLVDNSTSMLHNALYYCCSVMFHIAFHGVCAKTNPNLSS
jgi:hypothetical protein